MSRRAISHSEITSAYECQAKHAFGYTGHLTGGKVLKPHAPAARLRAGSAWGKGVAAFHMADQAESLTVRYMIGLRAVYASLDADAAAMRSHDKPTDADLDGDEERGLQLAVYDPIEHHDMAIRIGDALWQYASTAEPLTITDAEFRLDLPIPSRTGLRLSNRYSFEGYLDGLAVLDGRLWLVEYKFRDSLSHFEDVANEPQYRRYVWAAERQLGVPIAGILVDERLSFAPKPARWVKAKRKGEGVGPLDEKGYGRTASHAKDQLTTEALYREVCEESGEPVNEETAAALRARHWQKRHKLMFRRRELDDAGLDLVSAAQMIGQLDSDALPAVRNRSSWRCRGCWFKSICNDPTDLEVVEANFDLREPKRLRTPLLEGSRS